MSYVWVESRVLRNTESEMTPVALVHTHVHTHVHTYVHVYVCMYEVLLLPTGVAAWPYIEAHTALCLTEVAV